VRAKFAQVSEPGRLKDRLDEAWQSVKAGLVRGLSIGFRSLEDANIKDTFGIRFIKWEWLELSAVTIPANVEASITAIKSADQALRAASGENRSAESPAGQPSPAVAGQKPVSLKRKAMKTYQEQIKDLEATRAAKAAELDGVQKKATDEGRTKDAAERELFDTLAGEIQQIDAELKDLHVLSKMNVSAAQPVVESRHEKGAIPAGSAARVTINAKIEPGIKFARMALCMAAATAMRKEGRPMALDAIYRGNKRWMESAPDVELALKAAVNANDSQTTAGASEWAYAQNIASEFVEYLRPKTLLGRIDGWRNACRSTCASAAWTAARPATGSARVSRSMRAARPPRRFRSASPRWPACRSSRRNWRCCRPRRPS
jgi:hypothetical protein